MISNALSKISKFLFLPVLAPWSMRMILCLALFPACSSYEKYRFLTEEFELPTEVYDADYTQTWQVVIQVMKKFDLDRQNQEAGIIKTRWIDNTSEINFSDSFASRDAVKAARYKLTLNIVKGYKLTTEVAKVSIYKRQFVEQDFLQGWKEMASDGIQEQVLLYRIQRLLAIEKNLKILEKQKEDEELKSF